ncbi:MAG: sugar ABC transporter permease [Eubacteriales bacterium]
MATTSKRSKALLWRETFVAYLFLAPAMFFFIGFVIVPMGIAIFSSFQHYTLDTFEFNGLTNYIRMFQDEIFIKAVKNTITIVGVSVPVVTGFSLWVATVINPMKPMTRSVYRCIFYLPVVTGSVAVTVVWKWIFNPYTGLLNSVLGSTGFNWLGTESTALWCIILILFTTSVGQPIVLYVAALGNVDRELIEASEVDGASNSEVFWHIKWPQMLPTTLYILVITTINSFQCFALIQLLTSGGPNNSTQTIMYYIYYQAYRLGDFGYGNAMGVVLALFIALFSGLQFSVLKSEKD